VYIIQYSLTSDVLHMFFLGLLNGKLRLSVFPCFDIRGVPMGLMNSLVCNLDCLCYHFCRDGRSDGLSYTLAMESCFCNIMKVKRNFSLGVQLTHYHWKTVLK